MRCHGSICSVDAALPECVPPHSAAPLSVQRRFWAHPATSTSTASLPLEARQQDLLGQRTATVFQGTNPTEDIPMPMMQ